MKAWFMNLNPWVGELRFQSLVPKDNEEVQDYYSRVYLEGRKLGKSDQDVANAFLRGATIYLSGACIKSETNYSHTM